MTIVMSANARRAQRIKRRLVWAAVTLPVLAIVAMLILTATESGQHQWPNLSHGVNGVSCDKAHDVSNGFALAVNMAEKAKPDYSGVRNFGFQAPSSPADILALRSQIRTRLQQVDAIARAAQAGNCQDQKTASVIDADGKAKTLPLVDGDQPNDPASGTEANKDPRTRPVTTGTKGDQTRTNSWSRLDDLYGNQPWYTNCAENNLGLSWNTDVPRFVGTEAERDSRFILAVNTNLSDDQIRQHAASDGSPEVSGLPIVRTGYIINTRNLGENRCDQFVHSRSMIRVSLGKIAFDAKGKYLRLETNQGIFVDCHNMWRLPKSVTVHTPQSNGPSPKASTPSGPPPGSPPSTPPGTKPPGKCTNGGTPPQCLKAKDPNQGPAHKGNVPIPVKGKNPPPPVKAEPKPADPPATYKPPAPPKAAQPAQERTTPPQQNPAPKPDNPATGCAPAPGMSC